MDDLSDEVKSLIDLGNEDKTLYVQRDQTPAYLSLSKSCRIKASSLQIFILRSANTASLSKVLYERRRKSR
ncbi:hypothetical protein PO124_07440 [Bacillus licheniformis]|nr:hypothetical protein [Bacillus licheniformis]